MAVILPLLDRPLALLREIDLQALIQSIEADSKAPEETAEKIARAWEDDRKGRQESQDSQRKAAEESNRKWDDLRELYRDKEVLGAVAALSFDSDSDKYAWRRGMFVLKPAHGLARIANSAGFLPKRF